MAVLYNESFTYNEIVDICLMCNLVISIAKVPDFSTGDPDFDLKLKDLADDAEEIINKLKEVVDNG